MVVVPLLGSTKSYALIAWKNTKECGLVYRARLRAACQWFFLSSSFMSAYIFPDALSSTKNNVGSLGSHITESAMGALKSLTSRWIG